MKKNKFLLLAFIALVVVFASCTNRQLYDRWEARGIRKGWMDTTNRATIIAPVELDTQAIDKVVDTVVDDAFNGKVPGITPIYIQGKDTCLNKETVRHLIKWRVLPPVEKILYKGFQIDDDKLFLTVKYDASGKPQYYYNIKVPVFTKPAPEPTFWQKTANFFIKLGWWILAIIIGLIVLVIGVLFAYKKITS